MTATLVSGTYYTRADYYAGGVVTSTGSPTYPAYQAVGGSQLNTSHWGIHTDILSDGDLYMYLAVDADMMYNPTRVNFAGIDANLGRKMYGMDLPYGGGGITNVVLTVTSLDNTRSTVTGTSTVFTATGIEMDMGNLYAAPPTHDPAYTEYRAAKEFVLRISLDDTYNSLWSRLTITYHVEDSDQQIALGQGPADITQYLDRVFPSNYTPPAAPPPVSTAGSETLIEPQIVLFDWTEDISDA